MVVETAPEFLRRCQKLETVGAVQRAEEVLVEAVADSDVAMMMKKTKKKVLPPEVSARQNSRSSRFFVGGPPLMYVVF